MVNVKDIRVRVIPSKIANEFIKKTHYSGKVVANSTVHFGCFAKTRLNGVMSFGNSMNKKGTMRLVKGTGWNEFIELNRMAFDETLPKNSESRCLSIAIKMIKKKAPHVKWIISFADATQSGDGTIYRATGFKLVNIKKNTSMWVNKKTKKKMQDMQFYHTLTKKDDNWERLVGYMITYVYFLDKDCQLTVPVLPYSKIEEMGAKMYLGKKPASVV